jgi:hypothetical protein
LAIVLGWIIRYWWLGRLWYDIGLGWFGDYFLVDVGLDSYRPVSVSNALYRKVLSRWCYILFKEPSCEISLFGLEGIVLSYILFGDRGVGSHILLLKVLYQIISIWKARYCMSKDLYLVQYWLVLDRYSIQRYSYAYQMLKCNIAHTIRYLFYWSRKVLIDIYLYLIFRSYKIAHIKEHLHKQSLSSTHLIVNLSPNSYYIYNSHQNSNSSHLLLTSWAS